MTQRMSDERFDDYARKTSMSEFVAEARRARENEAAALDALEAFIAGDATKAVRVLHKSGRR